MKRAGITIAAVLAVVAAGCAAPRQRTSAQVSHYSAIEMETFSWGRRASSWRIEANGDGTYTYSRPVPGGAFRDYDLITHRFSAGREAFDRVARLLASSARGFRCEMQMTDMPYSRIVFAGAEPAPRPLEFNRGCLSAEARIAYGQMDAAEQLVRDWALAGEPAEVREFRAPRP